MSYESKVEYAKHLLRHATPSERVLYAALNTCGVYYIPQQVIMGWIVDVYIPSGKLVVEVDGGINGTLENRIKDQIRNDAMVEAGFKVVRFSNDEVDNNTMAVIGSIRAILGRKKKLQSKRKEAKYCHNIVNDTALLNEFLEYSTFIPLKVLGVFRAACGNSKNNMMVEWYNNNKEIPKNYFKKAHAEPVKHVPAQKMADNTNAMVFEAMANKLPGSISMAKRTVRVKYSKKTGA